jgi:hypothetical protein
VSVWDVTSFVEDWYSGSHPNYGLILLSPSAEAGDTQNERDFWASGGPLPVLVVNYTPEQTSPTVAITSPTTAATYTTNTNQILLGGTASDDYAVASVVWLNSSNDLDGVASGTPSGMNFSWSATVPLDAGPNLITVTARNQSGNSSSASITVTYTPPPSPPTNLVATAMPTNAVFLTWAASVTTGGTTVAGYLVYRNAMLVATNLSESFLDTNLTPGASYCYTVSAFDSSGSVSAPSAAACVVTPQPEVVTVVAYPTNGGTVGGSGTYVSGSQVLISAVPNAGWIFTGWSNGSTQNPRVITVPTNAVIYTAEFAEQPLLSFNVGAGQLSLNWSGTFQLQTCTNLLNPVWIDVGVSNGPFVVTMSESGRFFRLSEFVSTNSPAPPPQ